MVDVERVKENFAFAEVAERYFTAQELGAIRALPDALQRQAFYQCWTSKEAILKARGVGLSGQLDEVEISLDGEGQILVKSALPRWSLRELNPWEGYVGAVVLEENHGCLRCHDWTGPVQRASHSH